ncbi:MAG: right-handed parallel beta-helix repeat-containing protein, partial [Promethearchaeota archaeon]
SSGTLIYIRDTTFYFEITNNYLNGLSSASRGIHFYNVIHGTIRNNTISSCGQGIEFWYSNDNTIINNTAFNNNYNGVKFHFTSNNNKIINNTIYNNIQENGIWLEHSKYNTIANNTVFSNDDGIRLLDSSSNNTVTNNIAFDNRWNGIAVQWDSNNNIISKNFVNNNLKDGINIAGANNNSVIQNIVKSSNWRGIAIEKNFADNIGSENNNIDFNIVYNNSQQGILLNVVNNNTVTNNTVYLNSQNGICLEESNDNTIADNNIHDNYFTGIYLHNSVNNTLSNNTLTNNYFNLIKSETLLTPVQEGIYDFTVTIQNISTPVSANSVPISWENVYYELPLDNGYGILDENVVDLDLNGDNDKIDLFDVTWFHNETRSWDAIINDGFQDIHAYSIYEGLPEDPGRYRTYYIDGESKLFQLGTKMHSLYMVNKDLAVFGLEDVIILNHPSPNFLFVVYSPIIDVTDFYINNALIEVNYTHTLAAPQFGLDLTFYIISAQTIGSAEVITFSCTILTRETMISNVAFRMNWSPDGNTRSQWDFFTQEISLIGDNTPPTVIINKPLAQTYVTDTITIALSGDATHYWYYIESVDIQNQTWTSNVTRPLSDGTYTLHVYGEDSVGNIVRKSVTFTIDNTPPLVMIDSPLTQIYTTDTITITLSSDDAVNYWYYIESVDTQNQTWTSEVTRSLTDGTYTLHAYGEDFVGNIGHIYVTFTIETAVPTTTTTTMIPSSTTPTSATTTPTKTVTPGWNVLLLLLTLFLMLPLRQRKKKS